MKRARDIMRRDFVAVKKEDSLQKVAKILLKIDVESLPVVNDEGKLIGLIGEKDLIHLNQNLHLPTVFFIFDAIIPLEPFKLEKEFKYLLSQKVSDIMRRKVYSVDPDEVVENVCDIIIDKKQDIVPVVENGNLIGIITKKDIIRMHIEK